jgi:hypothetical protein
MTDNELLERVQEFRDYLSTIFAMFVFSAGIGLRSFKDNSSAYWWTIAFVLLFIIYINFRYGIKGINLKRKVASSDGLVSKEEYENILKAKAEICIVEKLEGIDYVRIIIMTFSLLFLATS